MAGRGNTVHNPPSSFDGFQQELVTLLPQLRAFARSLCGNREQADDLVQEAAVRAWSARSSFTPGTSMRAWTFTILRNTYFSDLRRQKRQDSLASEDVRDWVPPEQEGHIHIADVERALARLNADRRAALLLVTTGDFSYAEAAEICGCPIGTLRSRVSRARRDLEMMLDGTMPAEQK
ncbi:MAG: sigma-70 family RNA polymerase sigma factor [Novosphingobium sp.]